MLSPVSPLRLQPPLMMLPLLLLAGVGLAVAQLAAHGSTQQRPRLVLSLANVTQATMYRPVQGQELMGPHLGVNFPDPCLIHADGS